MALGRKSFYKSPSDLRAMVLPSEINTRALRTVASAIRAGVTTLELNAIAERVIREAGAEPNFAQVPGYRHGICANVNDTVVHGIPNDTPLEPGDMVTIDCGAVIGGWHSDAAICVVIPDPERPELVAARQTLSDATEEAMWVGVAALTQVKYLNEVGIKIEEYIRENTKYGIVEEYIGHGIGRSMHEEPPVFNYAVRGNGPEIRPGLVVCIEPIITAGGVRTRVMDDAWTVKTVDGQDACQWEQSVAVHEGGIWVLTEPDGGRAKLAKFGIVPSPIA